ncbi:MAG: hypothetical protein L0H15_03205 [Nitrosospira sp.]|nr:hypothetical protein [Nitrosospira sp.]
MTDGANAATPDHFGIAAPRDTHRGGVAAAADTVSHCAGAGGALLGFVPGLPQYSFDPQFLLMLVLPPILYQAGFTTSWRDFKANLRPIGGCLRSDWSSQPR